MIIVAGQLHVDASERDAYLQGCVDVIAQARAADGCLDFSLTADLLDSTRINVFERWSSPEQLHAFRGAGQSPPGLPEFTDADVQEYRIEE
jgi:quinol monooxygenase YgiN